MRSRSMGILCMLAVATVSPSCISDEAHRYYLNETLPAKDPSQVEIHFGKPIRSFTVIADLQARRATPEYMRQEAAKIGADAVIVSLLGGERAQSDKWASENTRHTYSRITGTAIIYR